MEASQPRRHLIITGTGRAGTTFLVQLLTELGQDTGFSSGKAQIHEDCNAGLEWDIRKPGAPYIVKSPELSQRLAGVLEENPNIKIDHAIVPMRDLYSAAESRRDVARRGSPKFLVPRSIGPWRIRKPEEQETILAHQLYGLIYTLVQHDIPLTLLLFPRLAKDPEYLFGKMSPLLPGVDYARFTAAFTAVSRPDTIHNFAPKP